jgi:hypothetical protein
MSATGARPLGGQIAARDVAAAPAKGRLAVGLRRRLAETGAGERPYVFGPPRAPLLSLGPSPGGWSQRPDLIGFERSNSTSFLNPTPCRSRLSHAQDPVNSFLGQLSWGARGLEDWSSQPSCPQLLYRRSHLYAVARDTPRTPQLEQQTVVDLDSLHQRQPAKWGELRSTMRHESLPVGLVVSTPNRTAGSQSTTYLGTSATAAATAWGTGFSSGP